MAVFKKKGNEVVEQVDCKKVELELEKANDTILKLIEEIKVKDGKIVVLSKDLISKQEEMGAYESIEENSETVFLGSGFKTKFIQNVEILNADHIVWVTPIQELQSGIVQCQIMLDTGIELVMRVVDVNLVAEFKKDYKKLLTLI